MIRAIVCLLLIVFSAPAAHAQAAAPSTAPRRGWLDVNLLTLRSNQDSQGFGFADTIFFETRAFGSGYPDLPSAQGLGIDVGFHLTPQFAAGINFNAVNYEFQAGLAIEVPHPLLRNRHASDVDVTADNLERQDRAIDLSLIFIPRTPDAWRVRLFGGPTFFRLKQQMVGNIIYDHSFTLAGFNSVDIQRYEFETVDGTSWGLHAGLDVGYFFSRYVGVGGVVRFNRGTVTVDEPLSEEEADLTAGHTTVGGGLRLRF